MTTAIENVSDTARWVALYRAMKSERPDSLFRDLAEGLLVYLEPAEVGTLAADLSARMSAFVVLQNTHAR